MADLVRQLSLPLGRTVLDKTGLTGDYDFNLQWTPDENQLSMLEGTEGGQQGTGNAPPPDSTGPSIFTAIQEQLGLKRESKKRPSGGSRHRSRWKAFRELAARQGQRCQGQAREFSGGLRERTNRNDPEIFVRDVDGHCASAGQSLVAIDSICHHSGHIDFAHQDT